MENNNVEQLLNVVSELGNKFDDFTNVLKEFANNYNAESSRAIVNGLEDLTVRRTIEVKTTDYQVGDIISFDMKDGEHTEWMAVKQEDDGMIFISVDCLKEESCMYEDWNDDEGYYIDSDLNKKYLVKVLDNIPDFIRSKLVPMQVDDYDFLLRIPTEKEIFGTNEYGIEEDESVEQFEPMKLRKNRIASEGLNGTYQWYWLQNRHKASAASFACVYDNGYSNYNGAFTSNGVRPLFKISNR